MNDNKTSLQAKRVSEDLERIAIDKKQKIEKIYKETGQLSCQLSSSTVTNTKEPDQSNRKLSSTTVTDTAIEESKKKNYVTFKKSFKTNPELLLLSTTRLQTYFSRKI